MEEKLKAEQSVRKEAQSDLKTLERQIAATQTQMETAVTDYNTQLQKESEIKTRIQRCEQRLSELYAKQGRKNQFKTQKERDVFINKQIDQLSKMLADEKKKVLSLASLTLV